MVLAATADCNSTEGSARAGRQSIRSPYQRWLFTWLVGYMRNASTLYLGHAAILAPLSRRGFVHPSIQPPCPPWSKPTTPPPPNYPGGFSPAPTATILAFSQGLLPCSIYWHCVAAAALHNGLTTHHASPRIGTRSRPSGMPSLRNYEKTIKYLTTPKQST